MLTNVRHKLWLVVWLILFLAACGIPPTTTPTPARLSQTIAATSSIIPTQTPLPTRTPASTNTPRSTNTPQPTRTLRPTPPPTFAPATPLVDNTHYRLVQWSPEQANNLSRLMLNNAIANSNSYFGFPDHQLVLSAALAQSEAISRFPRNTRVTDWRWARAYTLAVGGDLSAGAEYAKLLTEALNADETTVQELNRWFRQHQKNWSLKVDPARTPPQYSAGYIVNIQAEFDELGGTCLLLLRDNQGFHSFVVTSGYNYAQIEAGLRLWLSCGPVDLTGDSIDEISSSHYFGGHFGESRDSVWSLITFPPHRLAFGPLGPYTAGGWNSELDIQKNADGSDSTQILSLFSPCAMDRTETLQWNGEWFETTQITYSIWDSLNYDGFALCWTNIQAQAVAEMATPSATISLMTTVLAQVNRQSFPKATLTPPNPTTRSGEPSIEILDEFRYRLGVSYALDGQPVDAIRVLSDIVADPSIATSIWIAPAQKFLELYQLPDNLYRACAPALLCNPRFAVEGLARGISPAMYPLAIETLSGFGIPVLASSRFDFEGDGESELWFTTRTKNKTELWILARTPNAVKALFVAEITRDTPTLTLLAAMDNRSVIRLSSGSKSTVFTFIRLRTTGEPFVSLIEQEAGTPTDFSLQSIRQAKDDLFSGAEPTIVRQVLLAVQKSSDFNCKDIDCAEFTYILGLTYELAGNEMEAVDTYLQLWREYPDSPFTIMARAKLELAP